MHMNHPASCPHSRFTLAAEPQFSGASPLSTNAAGGEIISIHGDFLAGSLQQKQMIKMVAGGVAVHADVLTVSKTRITFLAPPMLLNEAPPPPPTN